MTLVDLAIVSILAGFAGVGVSAINSASPSGLWAFKPFSCRTCMSGWGAILSSGVLLGWAGVPGLKLTQQAFLEPTLPMDMLIWCFVSFAGTGIAHLVLGLAEPGETPLPPDFDTGA
jgi:hypothetical protein